MTEPYYGVGTHLQCSAETGHTCQKPSGRVCATEGCELPAGTDWGPYWCPDHDAERIDRISRQFDDIMRQVHGDHP